MKSKVVYLTSEEAQIITLKPGDAEVETMRKHGPRHSSETLGKNHPKKNDDTEHFVHELATSLQKDDSRILIVGPAQAKDRLKSHIDRDHPGLAKRIVGVETMDKSTIPQVVNFARDFFTKIDAFEAI